MKATSATRVGDRSDLDTVLRAEREIQKGLDTIIEHLKTFPSVTHQVRPRIRVYLQLRALMRRDLSSLTSRH